ncbi:DNA repair protein complementing XP-G cells-like [Oryzias melastigma]|uniref:DNA repair protein complementing XP-G cells-like n=1 Tax=Oryzias melastigma TaxID=30732 RepID=A0A834F915_ORYME|nr:DNA repair protein complementing XP-G cells-like [Oryzias melastigma]
MGVHGLWRLLESTGKPINPETLEGKILAVDISIWLNQAVKGVRDREGNSVQNAHLLTLFHRICKLLFFRIRPVFVFDGDAPLLKKQTLAQRRQRKEELTRESKQTNEKLLKTFLKRQALKAALGDHSKDPLPSLSSVRRDEVDDLYVLPAIPPAEDVERSRSSSPSSEEESQEVADSFHVYQEELYEDPNSVDINSEEFASLPAEMRHEMLKEMREFSKRRRTMFHKPPERSGDFSQYQLAGLLQRNRLNLRLEGVEKEMNQHSAGSAPQLCQQDGGLLSHSVEANRLVSEDHSHYILIKGSKNKNASENKPAAAAWSGLSVSGVRKPADRPEPLWRPVLEDEDEQLQREATPPSPRTLKAIQAAMNDSSDEDEVQQKDRSVSPRTMRAIQQALTEKKEDALNESLHHPVPPVEISSSDEETRATSENTAGLSPHIEDSSYSSSSEEELEEVIGQRNKALRFAALHLPHETEAESKEEDGKRPEKDLEHREQDIALESIKHRSAFVGFSSESFIEVPEKLKVEEAVVKTDDIRADLTKKEEEAEAGLMESPDRPAAAVDAEEDEDEVGEPKEEADTEAAPAQPVNEWEQLDMDDLEALETSLQAEQSNLKEQKQQQERMANTVTGQMYLESQELLRLFGVPFLVAPMEAEAQCAALDRADQTHGTITDDSDVWLFGGRHVYKNFFSQNKYVEHYQYSDLQNQLGLDRAKLINLAYLLGSDYTEGVPGVGYVTGMEILNEFPGPGLEPLLQFSQWWSQAQEKKRLTGDPKDTKVKKKLRALKLQSGFPNPTVAQAYLEPAVDPSSTSFSWGRPQLDVIKEYPSSVWRKNLLVCEVVSRKTEEVLQPVIKQLNSQQTQLRIDSFFRMEQQEKQVIQSQRLRRAVTCLKRKEREGEDSKDSEEEEQSPTKSRKPDQNRPDGQRSTTTAAGGFLGSELVLEPLLPSVCSPAPQSSVVRNPPPSGKTPCAELQSSSSGEDSDIGGEMVTARSVFEGNKRGRGAKGPRGRGGSRGRGRGKKL